MRRCLGSVLLLCILGSPGLWIAALRAQQVPTEPFRAAADRPIDIQHIRLDLNVDLPGKTVIGRATLQLHSLRPIATIELDAVGFEVSKIALGEGDASAAAKFHHDGQKLVIDLDAPWPAGRATTVTVDYRVRDPKDGLHFFGPTPAEPNVPLTVWSHGEPVGNRHWFPCFDHPDQRQTTELIVTVAEGLEVLSNGKLIERRANADKTATFHWKQEKSHVSYLVTLVVGPFDVVAEEWDGRPVLYYVPRGHKEDVARTFGRTREMLDFFSKRFGVAYPWEKYAQVVVEQFFFGGQENTSATTLTERALHDARAMLDSTPDNLIAHELAHQWWGDMVTCRDWAHTWLNEGFATYSEAVWVEHKDGPDEFAYNLLQKARAAIAGGKDRPIVDRRYAFPWAMFDGRSYPKGAWVLHMLRRRLGDEVFWKCIQRHGIEHRFQSVETVDLRETFERTTGRSLERFFYDWTERPGSPVLEIKPEYLPETHLVRVTVKQTQPGEFFHIPLKIAFHGLKNSTPVEINQDMTEKEQSFYVAMPDRPTLVEVDPEQAILAEINEEMGRDLWLAQLQQARSVPARVRAARHFGKTKEQPDREALAKALTEEKFWGVRAEIAEALGEAGGDSSRDALIQSLHHADPKTRRACADALGRFPHDTKTAAALKEVLAKGDPSYLVEAAALGAYAKLQAPDAVPVLRPWLAKASHNEVLRTAALEGLGNAQDLSALDLLIAAAERGQPRAARMSALGALAHLAQTGNPSDEQRTRIAKTIAGYLEGETTPVRRSAVTALRDLGRSASPALAALEALSRHDPEESIRDLAHKAVEQVHNNTPAPVEITRLREELDRLRKSQDAVQDQLKKLEALERKKP